MRRTTPARSTTARRSLNVFVESLEPRTLLSHLHGGERPTAHIPPASAETSSLLSSRDQARKVEKLHGLAHFEPRAHDSAAPVSLWMRPVKRDAWSRFGGTPRWRSNAYPAPAPASMASAPYNPIQVRHAYGFDMLPYNGAGQTIAIIEAYSDPMIGNDLQTFDRQFGLPNPLLFVATPGGGTPAFNSGWASETALDVEWAHAVAPAAAILLVEAPSGSYGDLFSAVDYAVSHGAEQVSMSWGGPAFYGDVWSDPHFNHPGVSFTAAAGDFGAAGGATYPSASPFVTSVGGTSLMIDGFGNRLAETAWAGGGGGITPMELRPAFQNGVNGTAVRAVPDVSYNADPNTGYLVYDSSSGGGWFHVGGTSAGAPQWAGLFALVNQGRALEGKAPLGTGVPYGTNTELYRMAARGDFLDITVGGNGFSAAPGYDLATGLGSPIASRLVPDLINA